MSQLELGNDLLIPPKKNTKYCIKFVCTVWWVQQSTHSCLHSAFGIHSFPDSQILVCTASGLHASFMLQHRLLPVLKSTLDKSVGTCKQVGDIVAIAVAVTRFDQHAETAVFQASHLILLSYTTASCNSIRHAAKTGPNVMYYTPTQLAIIPLWTGH